MSIHTDLMRLIQLGPLVRCAIEGGYYHKTELVLDELGRLVLPQYNLKRLVKSDIPGTNGYRRDERGPLPPMVPNANKKFKFENGDGYEFESGEIFYV